MKSSFETWVARHEREGEYPCPWDGHDRTFHSPAGLRAHLDEHHNGHMPALACPRQDCGEVFPSRPELLAHLQAGHPPGAAVKTSADGDAAEEGGNTMLKCRKGCDREFESAQGRALHERRAHGQNWTNAKKKPAKKKPATTRRGGRKIGRKHGRAEVDRPRRSTGSVAPAAPPNGQVDQELATMNRILQDVARLSPTSRAWVLERLAGETS